MKSAVNQTTVAPWSKWSEAVEANMLFALELVGSSQPGHLRIVVFRLIPLRGMRARRDIVDPLLNNHGLLGEQPQSSQLPGPTRILSPSAPLTNRTEGTGPVSEQPQVDPES